MITVVGDGKHVLQLSAVAPSVPSAADVSPWTMVWYVDTTPPVVSLAVTPPRVSDVPRGTAHFVVVSTEDLTALHYRYSSGTGGANSDSQDGSSASWLTTADPSIDITDLLAGSMYTLEVFGVDVGGNAGPVVTWSWESADCDTVASEARQVTHVQYVRSLSRSPGSRLFLWATARAEPASSSASTATGSEFEYRLDGGVWQRTAGCAGSGALRL